MARSMSKVPLFVIYYAGVILAAYVPLAFLVRPITLGQIVMAPGATTLSLSSVFFLFWFGVQLAAVCRYAIRQLSLLKV